eukprot:3626283-Pyramimonas_sp.AAC.1
MSTASYLDLIGISSSVVAIQEVHRTRGELEVFTRGVAPSATVFGSFEYVHDGDDESGRGRGGVAAIVPLSSPSARASSSAPLIRGRVLRAILVGSCAEIRHCNIRNHGLSVAEVQK